MSVQTSNTPDTGEAATVTISVIVPCRDELPRLPAFLAGIERQSLRPVEVVVADGASTDGTRAWWEQAAASRDWLVVVDNPGRTIPRALNLALAHASGELVARMDLHAAYAPDYLAEVSAPLLADEQVVGCGGAMESTGEGPTGRAVAAVMRRPIGMGGAAHRVGAPGGPVDHVFSGCYRRAALLAAGGFDEGLSANEDVEMDVRLRLAGGRIWLAPDARTSWSVPERLGRLASKMFRYGRCKAGTARRHPGSLRARQLAPPALIAVLVGLGVVKPAAAVGVLAAYVGATGVAAAAAAREDGAPVWRAVPVPAVVHLSWGSGLIVGAVVEAARVAASRARG
ncbi:glycosyltransferase family 2 protein [Actinomycetospora aeridis]|uniref:Glycosyltransferase family 2 protein n=1 Tax=Actinomycetospora aeridis TaxID=3129231 RepID=A0ABU8N6I5_9PSEU